MATALSFSVFKEKIIKTNELLRIHADQSRELEKLMKLYKQLKTKHETVCTEFTTFKLSTATQALNAPKNDTDSKPLRDEIQELKAKLKNLETETGDYINNLQIKFQLTSQQLTECQTELRKNEKDVELMIKTPPKRRSNSPVKKNNELTDKIKALTEERDDLVDQKEALTVEAAQYAVEIERLQAEAGDHQQLKTQVAATNNVVAHLRQELEAERSRSLALKAKLLQDIQNKDFRLGELSREVAKLQRIVGEYEAQKIETMPDDMGVNKVDPKPVPILETLTAGECKVIPSDEEVIRILKECTFYRNFSPVSELPETPQCSAKLQELFDEPIAPVETQQERSRKQDLRTRVLIQRKLRRKHLLQEKRKQRYSDLVNILLQFKKANINFSISNEALLPQFVQSPQSLVQLPFVNQCWKTEKAVSRRPVITNHELQCKSSLCRSFIAKVEKSNESNPPLLGFLEIKNETKAMVQSTVPVIDISGDSVVESLTEFNSVKRKRRSDEDLVQSSAPKRSKDRKIVKPAVRPTPVMAPVRTSPRLLKNNVADKPLSGSPKQLRIMPVESKKEGFKRPVCRNKRVARVEQNKVEDCVQAVPVPDIVPVVESETGSEMGAGRPAVEEIKPGSSECCPVAKGEKMPSSKIEALFRRLLIFSNEEPALDEIVKEFLDQEPAYITGAILQRISVDCHDKPSAVKAREPLLTDVQKTMLGFMSKLEKFNIVGVFENYLRFTEEKLLFCTELQEIVPITRLYVGICKHLKYLFRLRKFCCDMFYFADNLALPFFFTVLVSWTEVLPHAMNSLDVPLAKLLVQIIYMKDCTTPGYNLKPLRELLTKYYGFPGERWDENKFFDELLHRYFQNPNRTTSFALLLYCKNRPEKWVYEKIDEHLKPLIGKIQNENSKATFIILIGNLYNRFSSKSDINYLPQIREWFRSLLTPTTVDIVRRSVYLCLKRLKKK